MVKAEELVIKAARALQDSEYVRWSKEELLEWVSEAQIAIARTPGTYTKVEFVKLKEGTRQSLPSDGWALCEVIRNVDEDGTPLTPVKLVTRALLDAAVPTWHMRAGRLLVENYVYDERTPTDFFVYPPSDGEGHVEIAYMAIPKQITDGEQEMELDDTFMPAILNYVLYRATSKEADFAPGLQSATAFFQSYMQELSAAMRIRSAGSPNVMAAAPSLPPEVVEGAQ